MMSEANQRVPVTRLDPHAIVEAGLQIARTPGTRKVTVRELGTQLGTDPTAIYRHFRSKDALVQAMLDRLAHIARERVTAPIVDWKNYLSQSAERLFDVYTEFPSIAAEATRLSTGGSEELNKIEDILTAFRHAGLSGDDLVRFYGMYSGFTISVSSGYASASAPVGKAGEPFDASHWVDRALDVRAAEHPLIHETRDRLMVLTVRQLYTDGVDMILASAEAFAHATATRRTGDAGGQHGS